jgi:hypothetical protein
MSNLGFSELELAFFKNGEETLVDEEPPDFSDLDPAADKRGTTWVGRALAVLAIVRRES